MYRVLGSSISLLLGFLLLLHSHAACADTWERCAKDVRTALLNDPNGAVSQYISPERWMNTSDTIEIDLFGCLHFCGGGQKMYSWDEISESYLTWILPLLGGLLLQVPFESGGGWATTMLQLARWLGNPVSIFIFTMGNIHTTGRACKLFDRFTSDVCRQACHEDGDGRGSRMIDSTSGEPNVYNSRDHCRSTCSNNENTAADLRDGLYILSVLNQFDIRAGSCGNASEDTASSYQNMYAVLLFALFSCDSTDPIAATAVEVAPAPFGCNIPGQYNLMNRSSNLRQWRAQVASDLRDTRKRSVVPVLVSVIWFCVSLVVSLSKALGSNKASSNNLALGLLMCWLPALVTWAVVDRNPTSIRHAHRALQHFLDTAAAAAAASTAITASSGNNQRTSVQPAVAAAAGGGVAEFPEVAVSTTFDPPRRLARAWTTLPDHLAVSLVQLPPQEQQLRLSPLSSAQPQNQPTPLAAPAFEPSYRQQLVAPHVRDYCGQGRRGAYYRVAIPMLSYLEEVVTKDERHCSMCWHQKLSTCSLAAAAQAACGEKSHLSHSQHFIHQYPRLNPATAFGIWSSFGFAVFWATYVAAGGEFTCRLISNMVYVLLTACCIALEVIRYEPKRGRGPLCGEHPSRINIKSTFTDARDHTTQSSGKHGNTVHFLRALQIFTEILSCSYLLFLLLGQPIGLFNSCACLNGRKNVHGKIFVSLDAPVTGTKDIAVILLVGCLPLMLVPYAMYIWCTQSFLSSYDYNKAMSGLKRVRRWRHVNRGKWLTGFVRAVCRLGWNTGAGVADASAEAAERRRLT